MRFGDGRVAVLVQRRRPISNAVSQTDSAGGNSYASAAKSVLEDARKQAEQGNLEEARRLAETARNPDNHLAGR